MVMGISPKRRPAAYFVLALGCYLLLGLFSEAWLLYVGKNRLGHDFSIYYEAVSQASLGYNPYLPYQVGTSFLYHPFSLSLLSVLAIFGYATALAVWLGASLVAWVISIAVLVAYVQPSSTGAHVPRPPNPKTILVGTALLSAFGPFVETFHVGQINTFVLMALVLTFHCAESGRQSLAGFWLAAAVSLKTAPALLILYFVAVRGYRTLLAALITFTIFTLSAAVQFGPSIALDYAAILPALSFDVHPSVNNQSWTSLLHRALLHFDVDAGDSLMLSHRIGVILCLCLLSIAGIRMNSSTRSARAWLFGSYVMVMVIASPLVWYHHSIFLLIPLAISLNYRSRSWLGLGLGVVLLLQGDRFFEFVTLRYAAPVVLAHLVMMIALAVTYFRDFRTLPVAYVEGQHSRASSP